MKKFYFIFILSSFLFFINGYGEWGKQIFDFSLQDSVLVRVDDKDIGKSLALGNLAGGNIYMKGVITEFIPITQKSGAKSEITIDKTAKIFLDMKKIKD